MISGNPSCMFRMRKIFLLVKAWGYFMYVSLKYEDRMMADMVNVYVRKSLSLPRRGDYLNPANSIVRRIKPQAGF